MEDRNADLTDGSESETTYYYRENEYVAADQIENSCLEDHIGEVKVLPSVGDKIEVYWPYDNEFYPGKYTSYENDSDFLI